MFIVVVVVSIVILAVIIITINILIIVVGVSLNATLIGYISATLTSAGKEERVQEERVHRLNKFMAAYRLPRLLRQATAELRRRRDARRETGHMGMARV